MLRRAKDRGNRQLKGWRLWWFAIGALVVSSAIWWPAEHANLPAPAELGCMSFPAECSGRPPHPASVYTPPGR